MKNFKFLNQVDENDAIIPTNERFNELVDYQIRREVVFVPSETTQIYTEIVRMNIPLNEMTEDQLNHIKLNNEQKLITQITDTLDIRHEIIYQDENGFTMRSELFL
jgi:hypothetical protein